MVRFLLRRVIGASAVLIAVSLMAYSLIYLAPGDPATIILARQIGRLPSPEQVASLSAQYGLDKPLVVQYFNWVIQALHGDFGYSIRTKNPIVKEASSRFSVTLLVASLTMIGAVIIGIPTGLLAAWRKNTLLDHATRAVALLAVAIPDFWLGFLLVFAFSVSLHWLPSHGIGSPKHMILPVICLLVANSARLSRLTRSGMLEVEREKYLLGARAKGLTRRAAWVRHGFPNAAVPLVTLIAAMFSVTIASTIIIETMFALPGIGYYFLQAVNYRDIPVIQALVVLYGAVFMFFSLVADIAYVMIDPRIRLD